MTKKANNIRTMIVGVLMVALFIPTVAQATTYCTSLSFQAKLVSKTRTYSAGNMRCIVNDATTPVGTGTVTFTVQCKKPMLGIDQQIGTTKTYTATPSGYDNSRYFGYGVSSGSYYFVFTENPAKDIPINSSDVTLISE